MIRQLREGGLRKEKVKDLAATMARNSPDNSKFGQKATTRRRMPNYENIEPLQLDSMSSVSSSSAGDDDSKSDDTGMEHL